MLIAANHPNSFFDAILLGVLFKKKIHFLARGDAFSNEKVSNLLRALNILPIYRIIEGADKLGKNYETFDACVEKFKEDAIVLIFSEGLCRNEWKLRPLRKGTARLAVQAWDSGIDIAILPVSLNYSSFKRSGINVFINFGERITQNNIPNELTTGKRLLAFNEILSKELSENILTIEDSNPLVVKQKFDTPLPSWKKAFYFVPALVGAFIHAPFYLLIKITASKLFAKEPVHFNSIQFTLLFLSYPLILALTVLIACSYLNNLMPLSILLILPFTAWCFQQYKTTSP
jgi:1-acyl-sn-glycerol-3-phosphate acyltransferase